MRSRQNDRIVDREYGVAGSAQLEEVKAVRAADALLNGYYFPVGATEPIPIEG